MEEALQNIKGKYGNQLYNLVDAAENNVCHTIYDTFVNTELFE